MHTKELGFVLKRFLPQKNKLSIFSQNYGKIEIITKPINKISQLWPGMLIAFQKTDYFNNSAIVIANNVEILLYPEFNKIITINWIHKFLEIIYFFAPLDSPEKELFKHLYNSFKLTKDRNFSKNQLYIIKKIYTIKLLELIGLYPTNDLLIHLSLYIDISYIYTEQSYFRNIDKNRIKILKDRLENITDIQIEKMDNWILKSLSTHPNFKFFKTVCTKNNYNI